MPSTDQANSEDIEYQTDSDVLPPLEPGFRRCKNPECEMPFKELKRGGNVKKYCSAKCRSWHFIQIMRGNLEPDEPPKEGNSIGSGKSAYEKPQCRFPESNTVKNYEPKRSTSLIKFSQPEPFTSLEAPAEWAKPHGYPTDVSLGQRRTPFRL